MTTIKTTPPCRPLIRSSRNLKKLKLPGRPTRRLTSSRRLSGRMITRLRNCSTSSSKTAGTPRQGSSRQSLKRRPNSTVSAARASRKKSNSTTTIFVVKTVLRPSRKKKPRCGNHTTIIVWRRTKPLHLKNALTAARISRSTWSRNSRRSLILRKPSA